MNSSHGCRHPLFLLLLCFLLSVCSSSFAAEEKTTPPESQTLEPEVLPALPMPATSIGLSDDGGAIGTKILDILPYNVLYLLPKAIKIFPVYGAPFSDFSYGPYQLKKILYAALPTSLSEIDNRIYALEEVIKAAKPTDPHLMEQKIHLADLLTMKSRFSNQPGDIKRSVASYAAIYQEVAPEFFPYVALNMVNSLLLLEDDITAFPIIKKILKENASDKDFARHLNASMIELYFISGRHAKAWSELEDRVKNKEVSEESLDYQLRVGDILFFMGRHQEASDWYQSVLKPETTKTLSENVSWLYLAESVFQLGNVEVAKKIFQAMAPYFSGKVYADVIDYRITPTEAMASEILKRTTSSIIRDWIEVELLKQKFKKRPEVFTGSSFDTILAENDYPTDLRKQILAMQASAYQYDKDYYKAIKIYEQLGLGSKNADFDRLIDSAILSALVKNGLATRTEEEAYQFLRFFKQFDFRLRTNDPDQLFTILEHNLDLMGMKDLAAEMTLHIIEKSIHRPEDKARIYLRLAKSLYDVGADQSCIKTLEVIDIALINFAEKEQYYHLTIDALVHSRDDKSALNILAEWEKDGASAKNVYWIALKKVQILMRLGKPESALAVVEDSVGNGKVDYLPKDYDEFVNPLLANQVVLNDKLEKNFEALADFYTNQDRIMQTKEKNTALLAAMSSALATNKKGDVTKLLVVARNNFDDSTYKWLDEWVRGELWINQLNTYLDQHATAAAPATAPEEVPAQ